MKKIQFIFSFCAFSQDRDEILTLSKGRYNEVPEYSKYQRVGSVIMNMETRKIAGFTNYNTALLEEIESDHITRWFSVDPLAEKYYSISPYVYCANNPILYIDPDGREVNLAYLTSKDQQKAMQNMIGTKEGRAFIGRYMSKDQTLSVGGKTYTFNSTGDRSKDKLWIRSSKMQSLGLNRTFTKDMKKELNQAGLSDDVTQGVNQVIDLKIGLSEKESTMTLGHEALVHADKDADNLNKIDQKIENGSYTDTKDYIKDITDISTSGSRDHKALGEGTVKKYENYSNELSNQKNDTYYQKDYQRQVDKY